MDMDQGKPPHKKFNKFSPNRPKMEPSPLRKKAMALAAQYGMPEAVALQIASDVIPLEFWLKKQEKKKTIEEKEKEIQKKLSAFSHQKILALETAVQVLRGAYSLKEYREQKIAKMEIDKDAQELVSQANVPLYVARMIAAGKFTLEEYLTREAKKKERKTKAYELHAKYPSLALSTCFMILDEGLDVEEYLKNKVQNKEKRKDWYKKYLEEHQEENQPLAEYLKKLKNRKIAVFFSLLGYESTSGIILGFTPYDIKIKDRDEKILTFSKINIKYFCRLSYAERVLSLLKVSERLQKDPIPMSPNPYERYEIPSDLLQEGGKICLMLREGESFSGTIQWFTKYDIKLSLSTNPKTNILVLRHAVIAAQPGE